MVIILLYDARGYLNDLDQHDSKFNGKQANTLSNEEIELEKLLNDERYADLNAVTEETTEPEVRETVAHAQYSQVGYQYEPKVENDVKSNFNNDDQSKEDEFKIPTGLNITASNLILPKSNKLHCIIEKTAIFVARQGSQMEILLKTKQASNSNFNFLSIDSELNAYYRFLLNEIKSGKYVPKQGNEQSGSESDDDSDDGNYLHPSLLSAKSDSNQNKLNIMNVFMSKQENDSYSQLVKHFRDKFSDDIEDKNEQKSPNDIVDTNGPSPSTSSTKSQVSSLIPQPPADVELIICKLAQHVSKNGEEFEISIKALNDKKFDFLNPGHIYHPFYVKQRIHYMKQTKESAPNSKSVNTAKAITFSIATKEAPKKIRAYTNIEKELEEGVKSLSEPSLSKESNNLSKERQLQMERKKKAFEFLKMLRKENRLDSSQATEYGPNLPKDNIQLSPTIEEITSPTHSPNFADYEMPSDETKFNDKHSSNGRSLLPFTSEPKNYLIKDRSLSTSPKRRHKSSRSPPRRYKLNKDQESPEKSSSYRKRASKSSRSYRRSRSSSRSKERYRKRSHESRNSRSRHDRHSSSRSSRSRSSSPRSHHSDKHKTRRQESRSHRHRYRSPS